MEAVLGVASSIIALVDLTIEVLGYIKSVKEAEKDRDSYCQEAPALCGLLTTLRVHVESNGEQKADPWFASVRMLQHGLMEQYRISLETFAEKVAPGTGRRQKVLRRLTWTFIKDDVKDILAKMDRLKILVSIALQMDHLYVSFSSRNLHHSLRVCDC